MGVTGVQTFVLPITKPLVAGPSPLALPSPGHVMTLKLRNTLTRRVEAVEPLTPGRVAMYSCGPTVYRYAHVGNLRTFLLADLIRRVLLYHGLEVFHVQKIGRASCRERV